MGEHADSSSCIPELIVTIKAHINLENVNVFSNFGFQVRSQNHFKFLRSGGKSGVLNIREGISSPPSAMTRPLLEWTLKGSVDVTARLHFDEQVYDYWISDAGWYRVDPISQTIDIPHGGDELIREHRLWGIPALLCATPRGDFFIHAAAAEVDKRAILFAAPGRHGKTTLAMAFHQHGYRLLSEDSACCRLGPEPAILPGPALLRVRPDVFDGKAPGGTHIAGVYDDRVYLVVDEDRRGNDDPVPIQALIFLRESENGIHLDRMPPHKALPDLWALTFHFPEDVDRARCFRQLSGLAASVPIWNLYRPLRLDRLSDTVAQIVKNLS